MDSDPSQDRYQVGSHERISDRVFMRRLLITFAIGILTLALWKVSDILLLAFGSVLVALGLGALGAKFNRMTGMSHGWGVATAVLTILSIIVAISFVFGAQIAQQLGEVSSRLPKAIERFFAGNDIGSLKSLLQGSTVGDLVANVISWGTTLFGAVTSFVLVLAASVYIALDPRRYRDGFLALMPRDKTDIVADALDQCGLALRHWFGGQLTAMLLVGVMTMVGLWLVGVPGFIGLGLIAGLTEFVPILGPVAGAVPAILLASMQDWTTVAWVIALFVFIQQVENNVILPLVTGRAVQMPAAIGIFGTLAMGVLFGPLGLLFGYPLAIVADVLVRRLYVREVVRKETTLPSEARPEDNA